MWLEETIGKRINVLRVEQALPQAPRTIATACPYCAVMMADGLAALGQDDGDRDARHRRAGRRRRWCGADAGGTARCAAAGYNSASRRAESSARRRPEEARMKKVVWGVLSTAKIGRERVLPGMKKSDLLEIRAIASRDEARARAAADALGIPEGLRLVRGAARRSRDRGDLQPAAQSPARAADAAGRGRGQARAVRKADRADGGGGDAAARGGGQGADRRSVHGALPSAVAARPRAGARGPHRHAARGADVLRLQQSRSGQRPQQGRHRRRRPLRHRLLRDRGRALLPRRPNRRAASRSSTATRRSAPTA